MSTQSSFTVDTVDQSNSPTTSISSSIADPNAVGKQNSQAQLMHATIAPPHNAPQFYRLLHDLQPISDVGQHVRRYPGASELLAIRHCKELEGILKSWETSALSELEQSRSALLDIRNVELLLLFAEEQQKAVKSVIQRKARHRRRWQLDHRIDPTKSSNKPESDRFVSGICSQPSLMMGGENKVDVEAGQEAQVTSEFQILLRLNGQPVRCELTDALQLVQLVKQRAEQHVHVRTVYVRCIKELLRINVSNLMRLYTWSLRTRAIGGLEADKCQTLSSLSRSIV
jgi:hypothetical protein